MYPSKGNVIFKFLRTVIGALFLGLVAVFCVIGAFKLISLPFLSFILNFVMPVFWVFIAIYLLMWVGVWFSYRDFKWASRLCDAKESFDMGRYRKAVDYASFALNYRKKCGLAYYLRSRAYEHCETEGLPQSDLDMAQSLGINPDKFDF